MSQSERGLVLLTGASGFLGSHLVVQLLQKGYRVRATARGSRVAELKAIYAGNDAVEVIDVPDVGAGTFPEAFAGVDALLHTAAPVSALKNDRESYLKGIIDGTLNVVRQANEAGIKRIVYTSTILTIVNPKRTFGADDWSPVTVEGAKPDDKAATYIAAKTAAERALWAYADENPHLDIATINPPLFYGPLTEKFTVAPGDYAALSTNSHVYGLLARDGATPEYPTYIDVRDVAAAHVRALTAPPSTAVGRKRFPLSSPHGLAFARVIEYIGEQRPELKDRLLAPERIVSFPYDRLPIDFKRVEEVLGLKKEDFQTWEATILGTVDSLIKVEKEWAAQGVTAKPADVIPDKPADVYSK